MEHGIRRSPPSAITDVARRALRNAVRKTMYPYIMTPKRVWPTSKLGPVSMLMLIASVFNRSALACSQSAICKFLSLAKTLDISEHSTANYHCRPIASRHGSELQWFGIESDRQTQELTMDITQPTVLGPLLFSAHVRLNQTLSIVSSPKRPLRCVGHYQMSVTSCWSLWRPCSFFSIAA